MIKLCSPLLIFAYCVRLGKISPKNCFFFFSPENGYTALMKPISVLTLTIQIKFSCHDEILVNVQKLKKFVDEFCL